MYDAIDFNSRLSFAAYWFQTLEIAAYHTWTDTWYNGVVMTPDHSPVSEVLERRQHVAMLKKVFFTLFPRVSLYFNAKHRDSRGYTGPRMQASGTKVHGSERSNLGLLSTRCIWTSDSEDACICRVPSMSCLTMNTILATQKLVTNFRIDKLRSVCLRVNSQFYF